MNPPNIIETHRHVQGEESLRLMREAGAYDTTKPLPQVDNDADLFFYRDWADNDYAMDVQRESGVSTAIISRGGQLEMFASNVMKTGMPDAVRRINEENLEIRERYPDAVETMVDVHALLPETRTVAEEMLDQKGARGISVSSSYGEGPDQSFLDDPRCEWLWEFAEARDEPVHIHPPMLAIGKQAAMTYRLNEAATRPMDTGLTLARMIYSGVFDKYPNLKVVAVHMGGVLPSIVGRLNFNWRLNYHGIQDPPVRKIQKNERLPSEYCRGNIFADTMGFNPWALKAAIDLFGVDNVVFGSDYGPVPISPKEHIDLVRDVVPDPDDQEKVFWKNADRLFKLRLAHGPELARAAR